MGNVVRFSALKSLISDMEKQELIITTFPFSYNGKKFYVILTKYIENEEKPKYAVAKLEFFNPLNNQSLIAYADLYEVHFQSVKEFMVFFDIQKCEGNATIRDIFVNFSEHFSKFIPTTVPTQNDEQKIMIANRLEPNKVNAIFCYNIKRNGFRDNGERKKRTIENSNKAKYFRPELYDRYKADPYLSFYFSDNPDDEKIDREIIALLANRY